MRRRGFTLVEVVVLLLAIALLAMLCLPAVQSTRPYSRRNGCINNVKQLVLAQQSHHDLRGALTPAYTVDANGGPRHSWRSLLLPFIEENRLASAIDFSQPWNDPANAQWKSIELEAYLCLSSDPEGPQSNYLAVVDPGFALSGPDPTKLVDIADGARHTLLVFDARGRHAEPWMAPRDADERLFQSYRPDSPTNHPGVVLVGFADGHVQAIGLDCVPAVRRAMLTIAGGEKIDGDAF